MVAARAPFRNLSDGPKNTLLECRQIRPGVTVARAVIPGRQAKVTACVLNNTAEGHTLRKGEQLGLVDALSSADLTIVGPLQVEHETEVKATSCSLATDVSPDTSNSSDRDEECRQEIDNMLRMLPGEMTETEVDHVRELLWKFRQILSLNDFDIGYTDAVSHRIDTGDHRPIREALRRHPQAYTEQIDANVDKMLQ